MTNMSHSDEVIIWHFTAGFWDKNQGVSPLAVGPNREWMADHAVAHVCHL